MKTSRNSSLWTASIMMCALLFYGFALPAAAQQEEVVDTKTSGEAFLYKGDIIALKVYSLTRIAVSNPGVVEIVNADVDQILLSGQQVGETQFFIWDELGKRTIVVRVLDQDLTMIQKRIEKLLELAEIRGVTLQQNSFEGKIVAVGKLNKAQKEEFDKVVSDFSEYLINMVQEQQDLIQIDAQVVELKTTLTSLMGVTWATSMSVTEDAVPGANQHGISDIFRIGDLARTNLITATINAQLQEENARSLSRPSLVVADGESATINVGGEIPISSTTVSDEGSTESVSYEPWGVTLSTTPVIKDDDKIEVTLQVEIKDIVGGGSSGNNTTSFTTTTAETKVLVDSGQTIVLAGLIKKTDVQTINKVPFLGDIPILGLLFRSKTGTGPLDQEIVIILTPHIRKQKNKLMLEEKKAEEEMVEEANNDIEDIEAWEEEMLGDAETAKQREQKESFLEDDQGYEMDADLAQAVKHKPAAEEPMNMDAFLDTVEDGALYEDDQKEEDKSMVISDYARAVQRKIASKASFPYEAQQQGWKGTTRLSVKIFSDGSLGDVSIKESSGKDIFDQDALQTAKIVAPFSPFPVDMDMEEIVITIPVVYDQESSS